MDDRNRRSARSRNPRSSQQYSETPDYYGSRQAEQFEDRDSYGQDIESSGEWRDSQMGDQPRRPVMYYEEVTWRTPSRGDRQQNRGGEFSRGSQDSEMRSYSHDRHNGPARYDNGLDYFTSESQGGRDFSRNSGRAYGASPGYGYGERSYGGESRYDNDRGFFDRAGDEIASWFGDEDAARRRRMDHRGSGPANYTRSDERILEDACDCLTDDWQLDARNIQLTVKGGEVTLDGTVDDRSGKRRAEDLVERVSGVGHVQNNLRVKERNRDGDSQTRES